MAIFEGPARGSISDQFGVRSGGPFPGPVGGPFGDSFLDLPVDLGEPVGLDFRCLLGSPRDPFWTFVWGSLFRPSGPILELLFRSRFWTSKINLAIMEREAREARERPALQARREQREQQDLEKERPMTTKRGKARVTRAARESRRQARTSASALARPLRGLAGRFELGALR